ncbi:hypothetical protein L7F22_004847 [Adiantum nelumboides]|nr:hypothetical protein [Adiantum nelumboides]
MHISSKRVIRASDKRGDDAMSTPKVAMEDVAKDKKVGKQREHAYKLKSKIEMTIDSKKVFEERRILNSKVELTLGECLGKAKPEFHANSNDMVKRKPLIPVEAEPKNPSKAQPIEVVVGK